jgi:lysophospholipase L1-like esterase
VDAGRWALFSGRSGQRSWTGRLGLALAICALSIGLLLAGRQIVPVQAAIPPGYVPVGPGQTYLALGDSLATGFEEAGNADAQPGYPELVFTTLKAKYPSLTRRNLAIDGETSTSFLSGQIGAAEAFIAAERAAGRRVGLVTVSIGGNDLFAALPAPFGSGVEPESALASFRTNLPVILDRLLAVLTDSAGVRQGDLLISDLYNPYPGLEIPGRGRLADTYIPQFNAIIKDVAATRGVPVAEVGAAFTGHEADYIYVQRPYASFFDPQIRTKFDFHPRPAGHRAIADEILAVSGYPLARSYLPLVLRATSTR